MKQLLIMCSFILMAGVYTGSMASSADPNNVVTVDQVDKASCFDAISYDYEITRPALMYSVCSLNYVESLTIEKSATVIHCLFAYSNATPTDPDRRARDGLSQVYHVSFNGVSNANIYGANWPKHFS